MDNNFSNILNIFKRLDEATSLTQQSAIAIEKQQKNENDEGDYKDNPDAAHHVQVRGSAANQSTKFPPEFYDRLSRMPADQRADAVADYKRKRGILEGSLQDLLINGAKKFTREEFINYYVKKYNLDAKRLGQLYDQFNTVEEGSMSSAEQHSSGPEFTGYWKGTDAGTPGNKMVGGGAEESIERECEDSVTLTDKLKARWEKTKREKGLDEAGANNPMAGSAGTTAAQPGAVDPKELANTQQNLNKLKSAGVAIPNVAQAAKTVLKDPSNPATPMSAQDKQVNQNLGLAMKNLLDKGNPSQVGQLSNIIKQSNQQAG